MLLDLKRPKLRWANDVAQASILSVLWNGLSSLKSTPCGEGKLPAIVAE
ncbi:hypothetical protein AM1_B0337 (plasmid) [Acaryochloris marina MBIC11017]|uniref:Uncharacterized protein n=1 Tax=Acaryochloris marina (strain MBIC 11017) TaxID=329726 RepID=A8ZLM8_ACAM1|nr:hypothetical protein AM1_B0337 [Acaryochloris marina MBIC11017]